MEVSMIRQALILLYSIIIGASLGIVYDIIRIQRVMIGVRYGHKTVKMLVNINLPLIGARSVKPSAIKEKIKAIMRFLRTIIIFVQDIFFFIFAGLCVTVFVYHANYGQIRWFALFGLVLGFFIYYNTVGRAVMMFSEFIVFLIGALFSYIWHFIYVPVSFISRHTCRLFNRAFKFLIGAITALVLNIRAAVWSEGAFQRVLGNAKNGFLGDVDLKRSV